MQEVYKNAPLVEALCEFQFNSEKWDWTIPGTVYHEVQSSFPIKRQISAFPVLIVGQQPETMPSNIGKIDKIQFVREDESSLIQVGTNLLTVNHLLSYTGWKDFKKLIFETFDIYKNIAKPDSICRIGLRYINRFNNILTNPAELKDYFNIYPSIPMKNANNNFFMRNELVYNDVNSLLIVIMAMTGNVIMLDLDFSTNDKENITFKSYKKWIEKAHGYIEEAFQLSINDKTRNILRGE